MNVFPVSQQTYPYSASVTSTGTLVAAVSGKKIVGNIVALLNCYGTASGGAISVTVTGTQNGATVSHVYAIYTNSGTGSGVISAVVPLPRDLEFDVNTAINVVITATYGWATVSIGYYLKS
jgi:hypothetical protein